MGEEDETDTWPTCGAGDTLRYVADNSSGCSEDFLCQNEEIKYVEFAKLCDKIETCGNENNICQVGPLNQIFRKIR